MNIDLLEPPIVISKSDLDFLRKIGDGAFASVWRVKNKQTGKLFALKVVQKSKVIKILPQFLREVSIMYDLDHPNIIKLHTHFEDEKCYYLLMELSEGGSLFHKLFKLKYFTEHQACEYFRQIVNAVEYLHTRNPPIIHRDIKPENVLLTRKGRIKLTDFGWANYLSTNRLTTCGTLDYLPPEIIEEKEHNLGVDIWCLGVLLYEMLCGTTPFKATVKEVLIYNITKGGIKFPQSLSVLAKEFITRMLNKNQNRRMTIAEVKAHEWMSSELPEKCIEKLNYTDSSGKSTKESMCAEEVVRKVESKEDLISLQQRLKTLEERKPVLVMEKTRMIAQEKVYKNALYEADLELQRLELNDTTSSISEKLHNTKKENFMMAQVCKKQRFYLDKLKSNFRQAEKELSEKEEQLKGLVENIKRLNAGYTRIKSYKSVDISTLKINLDVMQSQLEDRFPPTPNSALSIKDLKNCIDSNIQQLQTFSRKALVKKIEKCQERSVELSQKIAELTIDYEDSKGSLMMSYRKVREELLRASRKYREDDFRIRSERYEVESKGLLEGISIVKNSQLGEEVTEERLEMMKAKVKDVKRELEMMYAKIKVKRKERFRTREAIDVKDMEIDDIKFELDKLKTMSMMRIWNY